MKSFALIMVILATTAGAQIHQPVIAIGEPPPTIGPELMVTPPYLRTVGPFVCGPLQLTPNIAWNGADFLAIWIEEVPRPALFASRLFREDLPLDGRGIRVAESDLFQRNPVAASDGRDYLIVWVEQTVETNPLSSLKARRLSRDGEFLGPVITIAENVAVDSQPAMGWDGQNFLVVWESVPASGKELLAARISSSGIILDTVPIKLNSEDERNPSQPSLTWSGSVYMIVWVESTRAEECERLPCPFLPPRFVRATRLTPAGVVLDSPSLPVASGTVEQSSPDVAWNGQTFLIIWSRDESGTRRGIWGKRVSADGVLLEEPDEPVGLQIVRNTGTELLRGRVESDGTGFLVVWQVKDVDTSIWGSRVTGDGFLLDRDLGPGGFPIANNVLDEQLAEIIRAGGSRIAVVYRRETEEGECASARTFIRTIGERPPIQRRHAVRR